MSAHTDSRNERNAWPDLSGRMIGARHVLPVRVYFEDTDFSGLVYHASYLRWCERGRSDLLRLSNIHHRDLANGDQNGVPSAFAVRRLQADFLRPARVDQLLEVHTEVADIAKASLTLAQEIVLDGKPIFKLTAQCVLVSLEGRLLRIPVEILEKLAVSKASS